MKPKCDSEAENSVAAMGKVVALLGKKATFCFYHVGLVPAPGGHCRSDSQSGAPLAKTPPKVKICVLSLFLLKKSKREER